MERQRVIETNRSLRLIKNELESLLEKGIITDTAFDSINTLLPAEASLAGPSARAPTAHIPAHNLPTPASSQATPSPAAPAPSAYSPPSYAQSTSTPPALPNRNPAPAPPDAKPILAHARALYRYAASDARDCSFERDDRLAVHEYMNGDWWMGRNERTGAEGIFPRAYVVVESDNHEKSNGMGWQPPQQAQYAAPVPAGGGYPAAPGGMQPYQAQAQPQQGQEGEGGSKVGDAGKKIGKKLGNAAIFGAGATIGSNIVNSIF